jgi:hypothetical protein
MISCTSAGYGVGPGPVYFTRLALGAERQFVAAGTRGARDLARPSLPPCGTVGYDVLFVFWGMFVLWAINLFDG